VDETVSSGPRVGSDMKLRCWPYRVKGKLLACYGQPTSFWGFDRLEGPISYVDVLRLLEALLNTLLSALAKLCIVAMAARATNTRSRPYSVKSWPSSSLQRLRNIFSMPSSSGQTLRQVASPNIMVKLGEQDKSTKVLAGSQKAYLSATRHYITTLRCRGISNRRSQISTQNPNSYSQISNLRSEIWESQTPNSYSQFANHRSQI